MTQPTPGQCDSPNVVTRNRVLNVLMADYRNLGRQGKFGGR